MPARTVQTNTNGVQTSTNGIQTSTNGIQKPQEKRYPGRYRRLATEYQWVQTDTSGVQKPERVHTEYKRVQKE